MGAMTSKKRMRKELPLWLARLRDVRAELKGTHWPGTEEGFRQAIALMAMGLEALGSRSLTDFSRSDLRWIKRWKEERAKIFSCRNHSRS